VIWRGVATLRRLLVAGCLVTASAATVEAEPSAEPPGRDLTVYILTMGVGPAVWERFGHNAIVIEDRRAGTSIAYNYGMFSFRQESFLLRFLQGRMMYWMAGYPTADDLPRYGAAGRAVWRQELRLEPAARAGLRDFLEWNAEPQHAYYRYDYYRDNCSTRVRDAIDAAIGGALHAQSLAAGSGSFRFHTLRLNANNALLYTGLNLVLGEEVDAPVSRWDEMFLPLLLHDYLRDITVRDSTGESRSLVVREDTLVHSDRFPAPPRPPRWGWGYFMLGTLLGGCCWWAGSRGQASRRARTLFAVVGTSWAILTGVAGSIMAGLWALTDHAVAARNENVLQCTVIALALGLVLPLAVRHRARWASMARACALMVAGASLLGMLLKLLPTMDQANLQVLAFTVPANLGLAAGVLRWTAAPRN
jgi:hypothetical protein